MTGFCLKCNSGLKLVKLVVSGSYDLFQPKAEPQSYNHAILQSQRPLFCTNVSIIRLTAALNVGVSIIYIYEKIFF